MTESELDWTVFEPSFVFGAGGGALKAFERLLTAPVAPVIGDGRYRHQPVWVGDVAAAFSAALERPADDRQGATSWAARRCSSSTICWTSWPASPAARRGASCTSPAALMKAQTAVLQHFPPPLGSPANRS